MESMAFEQSPDSFSPSQAPPAALRFDSSRLAPLCLMVESLTGREAAILGLLIRGASNREIALHACVSENTVKYHLKNVYAKLNVNSRTAAMRAALQLGIARF